MLQNLLGIALLSAQPAQIEEVTSMEEPLTCAWWEEESLNKLDDERTCWMG